MRLAPQTPPHTRPLGSDDGVVAPVRPKAKPKVEKPRLWKVILLNDDYTPRAFVTRVLMQVFRLTEGESHGVMMTAHQKGVCVVSVYTREVAETKAEQGTEAGRRAGYPLTFTTEPED